jgi:hypothetical protein
MELNMNGLDMMTEEESLQELNKMTEEESLQWAHDLTGEPIEKLREWRKIKQSEEPEPVWTGYDLSDQQLRYKWEEYKRWLEGEIATVKFTKVNGEERVMRCTLQESIIPKATKKDPMSMKKIRELNHEVLSVWDVKAAGWRSFRVRNVTSFICDNMGLGND